MATPTHATVYAWCVHSCWAQSRFYRSATEVMRPGLCQGLKQTQDSSRRTVTGAGQLSWPLQSPPWDMAMCRSGRIVSRVTTIKEHFWRRTSWFQQKNKKKCARPYISVQLHSDTLHPKTPSTFLWCQIMTADRYFWQRDSFQSRDFPIRGRLAGEAHLLIRFRSNAE